MQGMWNMLLMTYLDDEIRALINNNRGMLKAKGNTSFALYNFLLTVTHTQ